MTARLCFEQTSDVEVLQEAIDAGRLAVETSGAAELPLACNSLGNAFLTLYLHTGEPDALDQAVSVWREGIGRTPSAHPYRGALLTGFGTGLFHAYRANGDVDLLVAAEEIGREAIGELPAGGIAWAMAAGNLGIVRRNVFLRTGKLPALVEAVQLGRDSLRASAGRQDRFRFLTNLQAALLTLYARTSELTLIEEAVDVGVEALDSLDMNHASWPMVAANVVFTLKEYAARESGATAALDEAIRLGEYALASLPQGHPTRVRLLSGLSQVCLVQLERGTSEEMMRDAARYGELAVAETPPDHPLRPGLLILLGRVLEMRGRLFHDDLAAQRAVAMGKEAVELLPADHLMMPEALCMAGASLLTLGAAGEARPFFEKAIGLPAEAVVRLGACRGQAACHIAQGEPERALLRGGPGHRRHPEPASPAAYRSTVPAVVSRRTGTGVGRVRRAGRQARASGGAGRTVPQHRPGGGPAAAPGPPRGPARRTGAGRRGRSTARA
jgi:hypothetical protein